MDDIAIFTNQWPEHLQHLELTLKTLRDACLTCNPRKTEIGFDEIEYLGYRISSDSVRITKKRIEIIDKIRAPKNVKGLQRIIGMFQFWRRLIPLFSKNTYNMRKLLKKDVPFAWSSECEAALQYLKQCLISDPILKPLDPNKNLVLSIDGSVHGLGFCVLQKDDEDGLLHAVRYGAFATTPHQANYSADDLELTALIYALKSAEQLALLRHVTVITDNSQVLHVKDWKPLTLDRNYDKLYNAVQYDVALL